MMQMLLIIHPSELPSPEYLEDYILGEVETVEKKITSLELPGEVSVCIEGNILSFSLQRDALGPYLMSLPMQS